MKMTTFVLIHGAAGSAWEWHLVAGELGDRGHDVVAWICRATTTRQTCQSMPTP